jgi:hypothetical protein
MVAKKTQVKDHGFQPLSMATAATATHSSAGTAAAAA